MVKPSKASQILFRPHSLALWPIIASISVPFSVLELRVILGKTICVETFPPKKSYILHVIWQIFLEL